VPRFLIPLIAAAALAVAGIAVASPGGSGPLWTTVNGCGQGGMGVRASIPGNGRAGRMAVRFTAQYWSHHRKEWLPIAGNASSPWLDAGYSDYQYQEVGWNYRITPPPAGKSFLLRGIAELQWRDRGGRVVRSTVRVTSAGAGRASCTIPS
jgi:hypothetical protein